MTDPTPTRLRATLRLGPAVAMAITLVVGSGVLLLPGLAYAELGDQAIYAWGLAALVAAPLLVVIGSLGARNPAANGIAGFVRPILGRRWGTVADVILLGALPGGAGLALVGGHLVADLVGVDLLVPIVALALLALAGAANLAGARVVASSQRVLSATFVVVLALIAVGALRHSGGGTGLAAPSHLIDTARGVRIVFFAFVGWELMAFTSEEFANPRRDFPRMIVLSFGAVVALYLLLAAAMQVALPIDDPNVTTSPVAALAEIAFGSVGRSLVSAIGLIIVAANVNGVVMAFSRLLYASAREGTLPRALGVTNPHGTPARAVITTVAAFAAFVVPVQLGLLSLTLLFELAASAFFAGFVLATVAYTAEGRTVRRRCFGLATLVVAAAVLLGFGPVALYPLALGALSVALTATRR